MGNQKQFTEYYKATGLSREAFADAIGYSLETVNSALYRKGFNITKRLLNAAERIKNGNNNRIQK